MTESLNYNSRVGFSLPWTRTTRYAILGSESHGKSVGAVVGQRAGEDELVETVDALLKSIDVDSAVLDVMVGSLWTAVVIDADPPRCGLASSLRPASHPLRPHVESAGTLLERTGLELAGLLRSSSTLEASIGMAAFNALLEVDESECVETNAEEEILERG